MTEKEKKEKVKGALGNFFPDAASEAVEDSVEAAESGRLVNIDSDIEVVTVLPPTAGKVVGEGGGLGKAIGENAADKVATKVDAEEGEQLVEDNKCNDIIDETLPEEPLEATADEAAPPPKAVDKKPSAEEAEEPPERSGKGIAEALEQNEERKSDILIGLGFNKYDDNDGKIKYSILEDGIKIGVTFDDKNPEGNVWAIYHKDTEDYKKGVSDEGKKGAFFSPSARSQQPLLQKYYLILKGEEPIPKPVIVGKVVERRGGSIGIGFEEEVDGPRTEYYPAADAVKRDKDGYFIAKGFSKAWDDRPAKMHFPRAIRLPNYAQELKDVAVSEPSGQPPTGAAPSATSTPPSPKRGVSKVPIVTLEDERQQISANINWAVGVAVDTYKGHVEGLVPVEGVGVFIEKIAVTAFIALQNSLKCVEG